MALIDVHISNIANQIRRNLNLHQKLGERDHTIPNSSVLQIPPEIMGRIFALCIEDSSNSGTTQNSNILRRRHSPDTMSSNWTQRGVLVLGLVCKLWREITLSTPCLWTSFQIQFSNLDDEYTSLQVADQWFSRSGSLPLKFHIRPIEHFIPLKTPLPESVQLLRDIIHSHGDQWEELFLTCHASTLRSVVDFPYTFPRLRTLTFRPSSLLQPFRTATFPNIENLNLNLISSLDHENMSLQMLTRVELHNTSVRMCVELVKIVPFLRTYIVHISKFGVEDARMIQFPVEGRHVHTFKLFAYSHSIYLLQNLTFPALEDLSCIVIGEDVDVSIFDCDTLRIHLHRSGAQLKVLTATHPCQAFQNGRALQYLAEMPSLETLHLKGIGLRLERSSVSRLFKRLAESTLLADTPTSTVFLPNLQSLTMYYRTAGWDDGLKLPWNSISQVFGPLEEIGHSSRRPLHHLRILLEGSYMEPDEGDDQINIRCIGNKALRELMKAREKGVIIEVGYARYGKGDIALDILELSCRAHNVTYKLT